MRLVMKEIDLKAFNSKNASDFDLKETVGIISATGIDEYIRNTAKDHIVKAIKSIESYKDSVPKKALESAASFIVERSL